MNDFGLWFCIGVEHIISWLAYDHILFIMLLVLAFPLKDWRRLVVLITSFTLGHSFSLLISIVNNLVLPTLLLEFLIAFSILITAIFQLINYKKVELGSVFSLSVMVVFFGLIHGLGFSLVLKAMLLKEESVFFPLLYFNLGIELGQLIIVGIVLVFSLFITYILKWSYSIFKLVLLITIALIAFLISAERFWHYLS